MACKLCGEASIIVIDEIALCDVCQVRVESYRARIEDKITRLEAREAKARDEHSALRAKAFQMMDAIPFGQPILVGHHSEAWDRRYRNRIDNTYAKAFKALERADRLSNRVHSMTNNKAVSSDDPLAIVKLERKLAQRQALQTHMKEVNAIIKRKISDDDKIALLVARGMSETIAKKLLVPDFAQRTGYPSYRLTNNNARIRQITERLEQLKQQHAALIQAEKDDAVVTERESNVHGLTIVEDLEDNRIRLVFDGKPDADTIRLLKERGFKWSHYNKAWQRQITESARYAVKFVESQLLKKQAE